MNKNELLWLYSELAKELESVSIMLLVDYAGGDEELYSTLKDAKHKAILGKIERFKKALEYDK